MPTYERSVHVEAEPGRLFAFLSDVGNLPRYFDQMTSAERLEGERVHTTAVIEPEGEPEQRVEGEAWFRVAEGEQRIEWGSEGPHDYRGELDVTPAGDGSEVSVRISTENDEAEAIEEGLEGTLANVKRLGESL
jgi:uncharacterized membrane protein